MNLKRLSLKLVQAPKSCRSSSF